MIHTVSSIREWRKCQQLHHYKYVDLVRAALTGKALLIGSAVGGALDGFWSGLRTEPDFSNDFWATEKGAAERARASAMVDAYHARWRDDRIDWDLLRVEHEFSMTLGGFSMRGKIDKIARRKPDGRLYVIEHKTTSEDIETVGDDYWQRIALDMQTAVYERAVELEFGERPGTLYDVIAKPQGKPKQTDRKTKTLETPEEFRARMLETMLATPDEYLVRRIIYRTNQQQAGILADAIETMRQIEAAQSHPRSENACVVFGACAFLGVCTGIETLDSPRFVKLPTAHPELSGVETNKEVSHGSSSPGRAVVSAVPPF